MKDRWKKGWAGMKAMLSGWFGERKKLELSDMFSVILEYLGIPEKEIIFSGFIKRIEEHIGIISLAMAALSAVIIGYVNAVVTNYNIGKFGYYGIDYTLYNVKEDVSYWIVMIIAGVIIFAASNCIWIFLDAGYTKKLKHISKAIFYVAEVAMIFLLAVPLDPMDLLAIPVKTSGFIMASLFVIVYFMNVLGMAVCSVHRSEYERKTASNKEDDDRRKGGGKEGAEKEKKSDGSGKALIVLTVVALIVGALLPFCARKSGMTGETARTYYDIIEVEADQSGDLGPEYVYHYEDGRQRYAFAVIYETADSYIVCPIKPYGNGKGNVDTSRKMEMSKEGVMVLQNRNIK